MADSSGKVRAAVYLDSEEARKLAEQALGPLGPDTPGSFNGVAEGWLEPAVVKDLNEAGLVVELVEEEEAEVSPPEDAGGPAQAIAENTELIDEIKQRAETVALSEDEDRLVLGEAAADHDPRLHRFSDPGTTPPPEEALPEDAYNIEISGPITQDQRLELDGLAVDIAAFEPGFGYRTFLTREQYAAVRELPYVTGVKRYDFEQAVTPELLDLVKEEDAAEQPGLMSAGGGEEPKPQVFDCLLHREEDMAKIRELIDQTAGATVIGASNLRIRFCAEVRLPLIAALTALPEVRQLSPYEAPSI